VCVIMCVWYYLCNGLVEFSLEEDEKDDGGAHNVCGVVCGYNRLLFYALLL
jgi:hypothetical protein